MEPAGVLGGCGFVALGLGASNKTLFILFGSDVRLFLVRDCGVVSVGVVSTLMAGFLTSRVAEADRVSVGGNTDTAGKRRIPSIEIGPGFSELGPMFAACPRYERAMASCLSWAKMAATESSS